MGRIPKDFIQPGVFHSERLVNMSKHNYKLEPNVRFESGCVDGDIYFQYVWGELCVWGGGGEGEVNGGTFNTKSRRHEGARRTEFGHRGTEAQRTHRGWGFEVWEFRDSDGRLQCAAFSRIKHIPNSMGDLTGARLFREQSAVSLIGAREIPKYPRPQFDSSFDRSRLRSSMCTAHTSGGRTSK